MENYIQVDLYMSFVMTMLLAFGIALELPLLIVMLNLAGILTHERFRKWRRVLIFVVFLIAGIANYLKVTTDFRTVLSELVTKQMGNRNMASVFPGFDDTVWRNVLVA